MPADGSHSFRFENTRFWAHIREIKGIGGAVSTDRQTPNDGATACASMDLFQLHLPFAPE